jgi:hypothetical protein
MLLGLETKLDSLLVVHPSIKSAEGLKGKKVAVGARQVRPLLELTSGLIIWVWCHAATTLP